MYNFNFNESDMLSKSQNENILDDLEIAEDKEDFDYEDFVQQAIASGDIDTLILINELDIEDEEDDSLENQEVVEDDESFSIVEKDGQKWKVLSTAKGKYNAARKYNECITKAKNEVRLVSLKDLEKMNESRKNEAPANSESLFTALMSELNTIYKCEITDEGFLRCTDDGGNFIEIATVKNTDPVEMGMRVTFTDGTQSETVYYVYDNIQAVNDFIQAVFISEVNVFNDMNEVEAEEVQKEEKDDIELEDENQAQEEIDKNVEEVEEESEEEKTESLRRKSKNEKEYTLQELYASKDKYSKLGSDYYIGMEVESDYFNDRTIGDGALFVVTLSNPRKSFKAGEFINPKTYKYSDGGFPSNYASDDFEKRIEQNPQGCHLIVNVYYSTHPDYHGYLGNVKDVYVPGLTNSESLRRKSLNEDVIPAVYDSLIIRYKDKHDRNDFNEIVKILKDLRKTATFITDSDIREDLEGWRFPEEDVDEIINAIKINKNESKVTPEKIKREVEEKLKNVYKDYPEFYEEYVYVDTYYRDEDGRLVVEVRAELGYDDMISLSEEIDPIVKKYDKYSYFDMADSGILEAVLDFDEKNESLNENYVITYFTPDGKNKLINSGFHTEEEADEWMLSKEQEYAASGETTDWIENPDRCMIMTAELYQKQYKNKNESLNESDDKFNYMMLDRLKTDCEYFLGNGNGYEKHLWAGNVEDQIAEMRKIYDKLPEKPDWISLEDIDRYEKEMLAKRNSKNEVKEITRDEWNKTPKDYKMIKDGKPYLVYLDDETHTTVLGPCKIIDESLNEKYCTKAEITRFLKSHKATEVAFGRYVSEIRGTEKLFEMHASGSKKIAGTYDSFDLIVYPKGALYREELATGFGKITTKYYIFGVEAENIDESLNESLDVDTRRLKELMFQYLDDIDYKAPNYYKKQLKVDKEHKDYIDVLTVEIAKNYLKGMDLQAPLQAQFDVEHVLFDNFEKWLNEYQAQFNESLNEDGTVSDMGVAPIMPASYDDIDDIDDELFDITEGFLFPDAEEETDEDKEEEVNSLMGAAIEDINQGQPTASEWIEDAQYVFNSIKDDTVKNRLRNKYSQYLESKKNESSDDELGLYIINTRRMYDKYCSPAMDKIRQGKEDEVDWFKIAIEGAKMYAREIEPLHLNREDYRRTADYIRDYYINLAGDPQNESSQKNEASAELNKVIKDLAANDKTDVDKEINKLYKEEPGAKSNVADGSPILGATSPDNIVPAIDKAIMNKAIFAATSYANNGPQMFAKLQESFKNIDRKTLDDLMNSKDVAGIAKYLYESEMKVNKNEDTFTDPQMNVVNSNSTTVATGNSPETPKLADDIDPAPTEVQGFPKDKSEIENTNTDNKEDQLAKDSGTEDIPTVD